MNADGRIDRPAFNVRQGILGIENPDGVLRQYVYRRDIHTVVSRSIRESGLMVVNGNCIAGEWGVV